MPPDTENSRSYAVAQIYSESYVLQLQKRIAELKAELKEAHLLQQRTDYMLNSALLEAKELQAKLSHK